MALLPIITIPDPVLRKEAAPVERVDQALLTLAEDMLATMYDAPGVGLAAPQIGVLRRLIVMDPSRDEDAKSASGHGQPHDPRTLRRDAHPR